ncbi:hypothetical protein [Pseudoteredinibacter isoporae]|uniref:Uncharacterized protein n=1 Tax=Pseudoteredinibacter isoporae TaxID=570281 RepID=A0A7X0JU69_9GAMM|nr:hypothetical protein [Pseudoteredinibacter isoporae]MBB6522309.1 hypothetical protein [Pseudoteredinibacter isoporae]
MFKKRDKDKSNEPKGEVLEAEAVSVSFERDKQLFDAAMNLPASKDDQELEAILEAEVENPSFTQKLGDKITRPFRNVKTKLRTNIRDKAIERARTRILIAGQQPENLPLETLEIVVREEEDKIKNQIKEKGLLFVIASLGLGWWL